MNPPETAFHVTGLIAEGNQSSFAVHSLCNCVQMIHKHNNSQHRKNVDAKVAT